MSIVSTTPGIPFTDEARERLRQHFLNSDPSTHPSRWDDLWKTGDFLPWDRGTPNPALVDTLEQRTELLGPAITNDPTTGLKQRRRALVPGCGKGYDVLLLASFGYDAYGVEASANAVKACEKYAAEQADKYPARNTEVGSGSVKFVYGDFFKDEWIADVDGGLREGFDLVYDYTVGHFHAINCLWRVRKEVRETDGFICFCIVPLRASSSPPPNLVGSHVLPPISYRPPHLPRISYIQASFCGRASLGFTSSSIRRNPDTTRRGDPV